MPKLKKKDEFFIISFQNDKFMREAFSLNAHQTPLATPVHCEADIFLGVVVP